MPGLGLGKLFCSAVLIAGLNSVSHAGEVHDAISAKDLPALKQAIANGADLEAFDLFQGVPLHAAIRTGWVAGVEALLTSGADPNFDDGSGSAIEVAAGSNRVAILKLFDRRGIDVLAVSDAGQSPLHVASRAGALEAIEYLIASGAPMNQQSWQGSGSGTPAAIAAENDYLDVLKLLHSRGADIALIDSNYRQTPLQRAVEAGASMPTIRFLVEAGTPLDSADKFGETVLDTAYKFGRTEAAAYLESMGARSAK